MQSENDATIVSNKIQNEQLKFFRLHHCYFKAGNCDIVEKFQCFKDKTINLELNKLLQEDLECVAAVLTSSSCKQWFEVNLSNCSIRDHFFKMYCKLNECNNVTIKVLQLNYNHITAVYSSWVSQIVINYKVEKLWINGNHAIGDNKQFYCIMLGIPTRLQVLHMSDVKLSSNSAVYLFKALQHNHALKELVITNNNINDNACEAITTTLKKNNCLAKLWMWKNPISGEACELILSALVDNNSLEQLGLPYHNESTERTIKSLQETVIKKRQDGRCQVTLLIDFM